MMASRGKKQGKEETTEIVGNLFSKQQLLAAEHFQNRRDIINALLSANKKYTVETVEQIIEKYMKGQVK